MQLPITITQVGLQALIDATQGRTNSVTIASVGLSNTPFITAPTIDGLPGQFKTLSTVAGIAVSDSVIHLTALDDDEESYTVTGFGLYLDNGVLFGVYSQGPTDPALFQKSIQATFLFACDMTFEAGQASVIQFGNADFIYPPASETVKGVAYIATDAEVDDGTVRDKIVTPESVGSYFIKKSVIGKPAGVAELDASGKIPPSRLPPLTGANYYQSPSQAAMLGLPANAGDFCLRTDLSETFILTNLPASTLGNWIEFLAPGAPVASVNGKIGQVVLSAADVGAAPAARQIETSGLVNGGGDLSADRTINVDIATAAEALAGAINNKALTPASLSSILAALLAAVPGGRQILSGGLATGGGDLSQDRTITVPKASPADVEAHIDDTKAVTPMALGQTLRAMNTRGYLRIPGTPLILQWGNDTMLHYMTGWSGNGMPSQTKSFPIAFPLTCFQVIHSLTSNADDGDEADEMPWISTWSNTGFTMANEGDWITYTYSWFAIGI